MKYLHNENRRELDIKSEICLPRSDHNSIVALILFLHSVELKVVGNVVVERTWWLEVAHKLEEDRVLLGIVQILDYANQLDTYA
jgi:hypothetical protein